MTAAIALPGRATTCLVPALEWNFAYPPPKQRSVYAAAHVAALADGTIDWQTTTGFREHLWAHSFGVAEAMDTAQRGMGLSAVQARELIARSAADYLEVYGQLLALAGQPVLLHWLGEAFDPALRGYWGSPDFRSAAGTVLDLIERADGKVAGYDAAMGPMVALSRVIFEAPTYNYKAGMAFVAWLNGLQPCFRNSP